MREDIDQAVLLKTIVDFISDKGIVVEEAGIEGESFFPGIRISGGRLLIDRRKIIHPGDLLHEAGHIAVVPAAERSSLHDNITHERPGSKGEEMIVMLWTWAACKELNLAPTVVFHGEGYKGESQWIINEYEKENYIGLPLAVWMGLTKYASEPGGFPAMVKWLRD